MATSFYFDGKKRSIPGVYSTIKSGIKNPTLALDFGNLLVIDTGSGKFYGGGSGIAGTLKSGKDSIYTFDNIQDARNYSHGGLWWFLANPLFNPGGGATGGVSSVTFIRACATVPAEISYTFTGGASNGGTFIAQCINEGRIGNGIQGDETRAQSTITISNAGANTDVISIVIAGDTVATYTVQTGNTIAQVVAGLVASAASIGLVDVVSSTSTTLVIKAPRGKGVYTTAPTISVTGTVAGSASAFAGGVAGTLLTRGYAARMIAGVVDTAKFIIQFYRGTFRGLDTDISNGTPYEVAELSTIPELLVQSPEFNNLQELIDWANEDFTFSQYFTLKAGSAIAGTGAVTSADLAANPGNKQATGGTETYSSTHLNSALDAISDQNFDFILADQWGDNARSANNLTILAYITNEARIKPDMYVAGGKNLAKWNSGATSSVNMAIAYNSQYVSMVHGGSKKVNFDGRTLKEYDSIYTAAVVLGREAGLETQIPITFKGVGIDGVLHILNDKEVGQGLDAGVIMVRPENGSFDIVKGINTLQNNDFTVNPDGTTHVKQLRRISRQINKEILVNARQQLLKKPNGTNRNTLSEEDVKAWLEGYLSSIIATAQDDSLILSFKNIVVTRQQDAYFVSYQIVPNGELSFVFFSGTLID